MDVFFLQNDVKSAFLRPIPEEKQQDFASFFRFPGNSRKYFKFPERFFETDIMHSKEQLYTFILLFAAFRSNSAE